MAKGKKIDDKTREQIKAFYASCGNMNKTAKEFKVSWSTVKNICEADDNLEKVREHKKEQWINEAWKTINLYIEHVQTEQVIKKTGARDSAILIGTLHDKMIKNTELELKREEIDLKRQELEKKNKAPDKPNVDLYIEALKGKASDVWNNEEAE